MTMKKKGLAILGLTAAMSLSLPLLAHAGQWQQDANGWWWQEDDGSYPVNTWKSIDSDQDGIAESYYFGENGYMLADTVTPDGYYVNASGAWDESARPADQTGSANTQTMGNWNGFYKCAWMVGTNTNPGLLMPAIFYINEDGSPQGNGIDLRIENMTDSALTLTLIYETEGTTSSAVYYRDGDIYHPDPADDPVSYVFYDYDEDELVHVRLVHYYEDSYIPYYVCYRKVSD